MRAFLRWFFETLVRLYYPVITLEGREHVPERGPCLVVANHPNALLDPLVMRVALRRPVGFLGKSTLFKNPVSRLTMEAFGGIPVYRSRDAEKGEDTAGQNEKTFALCREALGRKAWIALFPEGTSHSDPTMRPMKTGAARIALSARKEHGTSLALVIVPVGLVYDQKSVFRSRALVVVGEPLRVEDFYVHSLTDERAAVQSLTEKIRDALDAVVLQADTRELLEGVARVASWTARVPDLKDDPAQQHRRALALIRRYRQLQVDDPARVERVVGMAAQYMRILQALGVTDPWAVEVGEVRVPHALAALATLVGLFPLALVGVVLGWVPYRLAGRVAGKVASEEDELGTVKLLAGTLFVLVAWIAEVFAAGWYLGWEASFAVALLAPVGGYCALRFEEQWAIVREAVRHLWLRVRHADVAYTVTERRRQLAIEVADALGE